MLESEFANENFQTNDNLLSSNMCSIDCKNLYFGNQGNTITHEKMLFTQEKDNYITTILITTTN